MKKMLLVLVMLGLGGVAAAAGDGLIRKPSAHGVTETLDRLEAIVREKGFTVFVRVDHAAGAESVALDLRPTALLIFGNPRVGTLLMQSAQSAGIDLPVKVLAYEDAAGQTWVAYNDPQYLVDRHGIADRAEVVAKMSKALGAFTEAASKP